MLVQGGTWPDLCFRTVSLASVKWLLEGPGAGQQSRETGGAVQSFRGSPVTGTDYVGGRHPPNEIVSLKALCQKLFFLNPCLVVKMRHTAHCRMAFRVGISGCQVWL